MYGRRGFYAGKAAGGGANETIMNPIMLKFRPIAPKPVTGGNSSGESPSEKRIEHVTKSRPKRKYVRARKNRCETKKPEGRNEEVVRTIPTQQQSTAVGSDNNHDLPMIKLPVWVSFDGKPERSGTIASRASDQLDLPAVIPPPPIQISESRVTVECITDACMEGGGGGGGGDGLGASDFDRIKNLEVDTCPVFVSDGNHSVRWINQAYRDMVTAEEEGGSLTAEATAAGVQLVVKAELPRDEYPAFACRVRVEYYTWRKGKRVRIIPCDVWRMDFGGFAWRLDLKAALCLGR